MPTPNGPKNQPRYDINDDPAFPDHLTEVSEYAASVGNVKVGTAADRNALTGADVWDGLYFRESDTKSAYLRADGAWVLWEFDSGWLGIPNRSAGYSSANGAAYKRTVRGGEVEIKFRGQLNRNGAPPNTVGNDDLLTLPTGSRPPNPAYFIQPIGPGQFARIGIGTNGVMSVVGASTGSATYIEIGGIRFNI